MRSRNGDDLRVNRLSWDEESDAYQARNRSQIDRQMETGDVEWGVWGAPESTLQILGEVHGKRILEFGCGAAQWSIALARAGARPVGFDLSFRQLEQARVSMQRSGIRVPIVQAAGQEVPFADGSFDIVFADYGAFTFADPARTIPHASRVLRAGGLLVFVNVHPMLSLAWPKGAEHPSGELVENYFTLGLTVDDDGSHDWQRPLGTWIRLFRDNGLIVEDMIEPRPDEHATSTYRDEHDRAWARRWPAEVIWRLRKA